MHEAGKLAEARHFLTRLELSPPTRAEFEFELSAFLSSARSVVQYALKEAKTKPMGLRWFESQAKGPVIAFFRDQRNQSVHAEPVKPERELAFADDLSASCSLVGISLEDAEGNVWQGVVRPTPEIHATANDSIANALVKYRFHTWQGPEDVLELCRLYLTELDALVVDGQTNGFLTA